jgi:hypothetical protein
LRLDPQTEAKIIAVFEESSRHVAAIHGLLGDERAMTGALVGSLTIEAQRQGLDITVRGFPDSVETQNGADMGIAISGPGQGLRTTKGFIAQAKRDDGPDRLSSGATELRAPRGIDGASQLQRLRRLKRAGAVIVYGSDGITARAVDELPQSPGAHDLRGEPLSDLIREVLRCRFGLEGRRVWDLMGLEDPNPGVSTFVHIRA